MASDTIENLTAEIERANPSLPAATAEVGDPEAVVVETPDPEGDDADEGDDTEGEEGGESTSAEGDTSAEKPKRPTRKERRQARYNEAIVARRQAEEAAAAKEQEAAYWRQKATEGTPVPATSQAEKTLADFAFDPQKYAEYIEQRTVAKTTAEAAEAAKAEKTKQAEQEFVGRIAGFREEHPDFDQVAFQTPLGPYYPQELVETIRDSSVGPQIAYYLGQNLDKTDAMLRMTPAQQARELGRLEARFEAATAAPKPAPATPATPPRTVTRAPAVGSTVHATAPGAKAIGEMSVKDHIEAIRVRQRR